MAGEEGRGDIRPEDIGDELDLSAATAETSSPADETSTPTSDKLGSVAPSMATHLTPGQQLRVKSLHNRTLENRQKSQPDAEWQEGGIVSKKLLDQHKARYGRGGTYPLDKRAEYPHVPQNYWQTQRPEGRPNRLTSEEKELSEKVAVELETPIEWKDGHIKPNGRDGNLYESDAFSSQEAYELEDRLASIPASRDPFQVNEELPPRVLWEVAESIATANPEMVRDMSPAEFNELAAEVVRAKYEVESCEQRLQVYGRADKVLIEALGSYDTNAQLMSRGVQAVLYTAIPMEEDQDLFKTFMHDSRRTPPLSDEELKKKWSADPKTSGKASNFEVALAIHQLVMSPDITPRQQAQLAQELVAKEKSELKGKLEEAKKKTALLKPST